MNTFEADISARIGHKLRKIGAVLIETRNDKHGTECHYAVGDQEFVISYREQDGLSCEIKNDDGEWIGLHRSRGDQPRSLSNNDLFAWLRTTPKNYSGNMAYIGKGLLRHFAQR